MRVSSEIRSGNVHRPVLDSRECIGELLPGSRLERSRCAADAFACAGPVVEVMI